MNSQSSFIDIDWIELHNLFSLLHSGRWSLSFNCKNDASEEYFVEPCVIAAAKESAVDLRELLDCVPKRLRVWLEPGCVAYQIENEEDGKVRLIVSSILVRAST